MSSKKGIETQERNIALLVIDAVASDIDDNPDIAKKNIEELANSPLIATRHWLDNLNPYPNPDTPEYAEKIARQCPYVQSLIPEKPDPQKDAIREVAKSATDIIIAGGSLRNQHYDAFHFVMAKLRGASRVADIHIPLDCTYSFSQHYDSGESWTDGSLGNPDMPVVKAYPEALQRIATPGYRVMVDGSQTSQSSVMTLYIWSTAAKMLDYLAAPPKK